MIALEVIVGLLGLGVGAAITMLFGEQALDLFQGDVQPWDSLAGLMALIVAACPIFLTVGAILSLAGVDL